MVLAPEVCRAMTAGWLLALLPLAAMAGEATGGTDLARWEGI
jgi:hypothetical protein